MCFIYDGFSPGTLILTVADATLGMDSLPGSAELCRDPSSATLTFLSSLSLQNYV